MGSRKFAILGRAPTDRPAGPHSRYRIPLAEEDVNRCIESKPRNEAGEPQLTPSRGSVRPGLLEFPAAAASRATCWPAVDNRQHRRSGVEVILVDLGWVPLYRDGYESITTMSGIYGHLVSSEFLS